jgi:hypothetical protein
MVMTDTVTVSETAGASYAWGAAGFTWASASAGKSWSSAYPAVYGIAVDVPLGLSPMAARQPIKQANEALGFVDARASQVTLRQTEVVGFIETYSDFIAFVLRWVESLGMAEGLAKASYKPVSEGFVSTDALNRNSLKRVPEALMLAESLARASVKRQPEWLAVAEVVSRNSRKAFLDTFALGDDVDRAIVKHLLQTLSLTETYSDLIAFMLRISEGLHVAEVGSKTLRRPIAETFGLADNSSRQATLRVTEAVAIAEALGRTVAYRRSIDEGLTLDESLKRALRINASEALGFAEQYRRHANGVISDMIVGSSEITEVDFASIVEAGHPPGYTDFRDFIPGDYTYRRALFRAILKSRNSDRGFIDALRVTIDVPDIFDRGTEQITDAAAGITVYFARAFRIPPEVTLTHKGGTVVAIPRLLGAVSTTGFTAVLESTAAARVAGSFTWIAQGY